MSDERTGVRFSETMGGFIGFGEADPWRGQHAGRTTRTKLRVWLTVVIDDLARFLDDADHATALQGSVVCEPLGGTLSIARGTFNLFAVETDPTRCYMRYLIHFADSVGHPLTLTGVKIVRSNAPLAVWRETSTLRVRVLRGHVAADADAELVASGVLRLSVPALVRQVTTFRGMGRSWQARTGAVVSFLLFFGSQLWRLYWRRTGRSRER